MCIRDATDAMTPTVTAETSRLCDRGINAATICSLLA